MVYPLSTIKNLIALKWKRIPLHLSFKSFALSEYKNTLHLCAKVRYSADGNKLPFSGNGMTTWI
jgi:hypothetical protein